MTQQQQAVLLNKILTTEVEEVQKFKDLLFFLFDLKNSKKLTEFEFKQKKKRLIKLLKEGRFSPNNVFVGDINVMKFYYQDDVVSTKVVLKNIEKKNSLVSKDSQKRLEEMKNGSYNIMDNIF